MISKSHPMCSDHKCNLSIWTWYYYIHKIMKYKLFLGFIIISLLQKVNDKIQKFLSLIHEHDVVKVVIHDT